MVSALLSTGLPLLVLRLVDESPEPEDVKAGWTALIVFLLLLVAVGLLGLSLVRHLRKAAANESSGMFGPRSGTDGTPDDGTTPRRRPGADPTERS
jgi:predicted permease